MPGIDVTGMGNTVSVKGKVSIEGFWNGSVYLEFVPRKWILGVEIYTEGMPGMILSGVGMKGMSVYT